MTSSSQLKKIIEFSRPKYLSLDSPHGLNHAERTVILARHLGELTDPELDQRTLEAGAWLHQLHDDPAEEIASVLRDLGLDEHTRTALFECSQYTSRSKSHLITTVEGSIVFDADKLQILGAFGMIRELFCREYSDFVEAVRFAHDLQTDMSERLKTSAARSLGEILMKEGTSIFESFSRENEGCYAELHA